MSRSVLIAGAGIAGPTLAYWLLRAGMKPTLIEAAPALRTGGYMIDFWGLGFEVAERMGLEVALRERGYDMTEARFVDEGGHTRARLPVEVLRRAVGERYVSILRGDLAAEIFATVDGRIETLFGDEVAGLTQDATGVDVLLAQGGPRRFDLVIGAEGVHSPIRAMEIESRNAIVPLGYYVAAFTVDQYPHRDPLQYVSRTCLGRQVARVNLRDGRTIFFMIVAADQLGIPQPRSSLAQRLALRRVFADIGWESRDILAALERTEDLYFDEVCQVRLPRWSSGRVALVGDAAYCPSLLAGEGASFAMAGAYILAGELTVASDPLQALLAYERRLRSFIERKQRAALRLGSWFAPRSSLGLYVRNQVTRLAGWPGLSRLIVAPLLHDALSLPAYHWSSERRVA
jgi:2-polyprenyl-6-methoxyphenol hydroxylase-like FAD-dependent oxidoreductase